MHKMLSLLIHPMRALNQIDGRIIPSLEGRNRANIGTDLWQTATLCVNWRDFPLWSDGYGRIAAEVVIKPVHSVVQLAAFET